MGDGRTPTITIVGGNSEGTVTLTDAKSAWPFTAPEIQRDYQERKTRESSTGPGKTYRIYRPFNGSEVSLPFQATVDAADMLILLDIAQANPPLCEVTYLSGGGYTETWDATLADFKPLPDVGGDNDPDGPTEYIVSGTLLRESD